MGDNPKQRVAHRIAFRNTDNPSCEVCGISNQEHKSEVGLQLDAHHLDGDSENNTPENLILVCRNCHRGIHRNKAEKFEQYHEKLPEDKQWDKAKEWKTMRVPTDSWTLAKEAKSESGMTWGEWLEYPIEAGVEDEQPDVNIDETRKAAKQAEANTEEIKRQLEALQGAMV